MPNDSDLNHQAEHTLDRAISNSPVQPVLYNIPTWCRVMGFGRSKTYELIARGHLKAIKIAGRTLIPASEAHRLIQEAQ